MQDYAQLGRKGELLEIVQEIKICPCWQIVYEQTRIFLRKWDP